MGEREPIVTIPGPVLGVLALMAGVHLVRLVLPVEGDEWLVLLLGLIPGRYQGLAPDLPGGGPAAVTAFLTHAFVHGGWLHLSFNAIWLVIFGSLVARRIGALRFLAFFAFTAVAGGAAFLLTGPPPLAIVVGASGAVSGLMGAAMRLLVSAIDDPTGMRQLRQAPWLVRLMPLSEALRDRRLLFATAIWLLINLLTALGLGGDASPGGIAWQAHVGGYFAGLLTFAAFDVQLRSAPPVKPLEH